MNNKTVLVVLFLFVCGAGVSRAAVNEEGPSPSYYYGSAPYEQSIEEPEAGDQLYPDYMPQEFGRRIQPEQTPPPLAETSAPLPEPQPQPEQAMPGEVGIEEIDIEEIDVEEVGMEEKPVSADFVPYDEARRRSVQSSVSQPPELPAPASADTTPTAGAAQAGVDPEILEMQDEDGFIPYDYAREKYSDFTSPNGSQ